MNWVSVLEDFSIWIILLPAITGFILFKRLDSDSRIIFLVVLLALGPQVLKSFLDGTLVLTVVYNLYTPMEFIVYWILFRQKITSKTRKKMLDVTAYTFFAVSVYLFYHNNIFERFLNEWVVLSNIFQVSWVGLCLLEYYYSEDGLINSSQPFFWFLIAITGYASCTAVFFSLWHLIKNNTEQQFYIVNAIHHIFNTLLYVFFTIGFLKNLNKYHN
jgi:hypothetical protein